MKYSEKYYHLFSLKDLRDVLYKESPNKQGFTKDQLETYEWLRRTPLSPSGKKPGPEKASVLQIANVSPEAREEAGARWHDYAVKNIRRLNQNKIFLSVHFAGLLDFGPESGSENPSVKDLDNKVAGLMRNQIAGRDNDAKLFIRKRLLLRLLRETDSLAWIIEKNTELARHFSYPWRKLADFVRGITVSLQKQDAAAEQKTDQKSPSGILARKLYLPLLEEITSCLSEAEKADSAEKRGNGLALLFLTALLGANMYNLAGKTVGGWETCPELESLEIWDSENLYLRASGTKSPGKTVPEETVSVSTQEENYTRTFLKNVSDIGIIGGSSLLILGKVGDDIMNSQADPYTLEMASDILYYGIVADHPDNYRKAYLCSKRSYDLRKRAGMPAGTSAFNLGYYYYMQVYGSQNAQDNIRSMGLPPAEKDPVLTSIKYLSEAAGYGHPSAINSLGNHAQKLQKDLQKDLSPGETPSEADRQRLKYLSFSALRFAREKGLNHYSTFKGFSEAELSASGNMTAIKFQDICSFFMEVFYEKSASLYGLHGMNNYSRFLTKQMETEIEIFSKGSERPPETSAFRRLKKEMLKNLKTLAETCRYPRALTEYALCMIRKQNILMDSMEGLEGFTDLMHELDLCYLKYHPDNRRKLSILGIKTNERAAEDCLKAATSYTMPQLKTFQAFYTYALFQFYKKRFREAYQTADLAWKLIPQEPDEDNFRNTGKTSHEVMGDFLTLLQLRCVTEAPEDIGLTAAMYRSRREPGDTIRYFRSIYRNKNGHMTPYEAALIAELKKLNPEEMTPADSSVKIPLVTPETESVKYWYDRLSPMYRDDRLASQGQIQDINSKAFGTVGCEMHDIFSYERRYHEPEREREWVIKYLQDMTKELSLGETTSSWKADCEKRARHAAALSPFDDFCLGIAKEKTVARSIPAESIPDTIKNAARKTDDCLRIAELEKGDPFIAFLFTEEPHYFWVHTTCARGWIPEAAAERYLSKEQWEAARRKTYMDLTPGNLLEVMFRDYDAPYQRGSGTDCTGYIRRVFAEFGIMMPLNSRLQPCYPSRRHSLEGLTDDEKREIIRTLPMGAALYMPNHAMLYLGEVNGHIYVINALDEFYDLDHKLQKSARITVNTLDLMRAGGETWLTSLTAAVVPWEK